MREIPLTRGLVALVDDEDYERICSSKWFAQPRGESMYAVRRKGPAGKQRVIPMHREVLDFPDAPCIDHANGNTLDNRRSNLRACSFAENAWNSRAVRGLRLKGVQQYAPAKWRARIRINGHLTHIGSFANEHEAALAYDAAARKHFGEFACVNFPREGERPAVQAA